MRRSEGPFEVACQSREGIGGGGVGANPALYVRHFVIVEIQARARELLVRVLK